MDNITRFAAVIYVAVSLLSGCRHCLEVTQKPSNATVLLASPARFNCTVLGEWKTIIWFLNDAPVVTLSPAGITAHDSGFTAINYTSNGLFTSELIITSVRISDTGWVKCNFFTNEYFHAYLSVQVNGTVRITNDSLIAVVHERTYIVCQASGWLPAPQMTWLINDSPVDPSNYITTKTAVSGGLEDAVSILNMTFGQNETVSCLASIAALPGPQSSTVFLTVRDKPAESSNMDYTTKVIIIAVTVSVGGLLLLIILIVVIVLCCRRRKKESSYQSQLKKVSTQRTTNLNTISKSDAAEANLGYNFEEPNNRRPLPEIPYESSSISDSFGQENNMDDITAPVSIPYNGHHQNPTVPWKVRHLTHV